MFELSRKLLLASLFIIFGVTAQEQTQDVEEVVIVGSQIKGAKITGALPVTVLSASDIDIIGASDGDELINSLVEQGVNYFNEGEQTSGGVNAARGDVGAYNLRNLGVGNTLTLLNGRRLVNNAGYQTESVGGDFVPTLTVNTNGIPTNSLERLEILKDGASAIYGADAVAGVINNILEKDFEGFELQIRRAQYDVSDAKDHDINAKYGFFLNEGKTNVSISLNLRDRGRIPMSDDPKWSVGDYRTLLPASSPWAAISDLNNTYTLGMMQLDITGTRSFTDSAGEMQIFPSSMSQCSNSKAVDTGYGSCIVPDTDYRYAPQEMRDYRGEMQRQNLFIFINHEMENGMEFFSEIGAYHSDTKRYNEQGGFSAGQIKIPSTYYYFSQIPGLNITNNSTVIDGWRPFNLGRIMNIDKEDQRFLFGFRGTTASNWDWESAVVHSRSRTRDLTNNRVSYAQLKAALESSLPSTFNLFDPNNLTNNIETITTDVYRKDESLLTSWDFKLSNNEVMQLPAGPVGALIGLEWRKEEYADNRDPRLDGTERFVGAGSSPTNTHPFLSGIMGSSPTSDTYGDKTVKSVFVELQIPITDKINAQAAIRHEAFSDSDSATVGKLAIGYDIADWLLFRASTSTSFRPPNLVQVNQKEVARTGTLIDPVMQYVATANNLDHTGTIGDYDFTVRRYSEGATDLKPEESTNTSMGFVIQPKTLEGLTVTVDAWTIEKDNTIGLFGRSNSMIQDLLARIKAGNSNCSGDIGYSSVIRNDLSDIDSTESGYFANAGLCPVGRANYVADEYQNLATRTLEGTDIVIYYDLETSLGDFRITYSTSETSKFEQVPSGQFAALQSAVNDGTLPAYVRLTGFGDLIADGEGNFEQKDSFRLNYSNGNYGASISALKISDFIDAGMKLADGTKFVVPAMTTLDAAVHYKFIWNGSKARLKFAVKNLQDERAPIADGYNGYFSDVHSDLGRNYYLDLTINY